MDHCMQTIIAYLLFTWGRQRGHAVRMVYIRGLITRYNNNVWQSVGKILDHPTGTNNVILGYNGRDAPSVEILLFPKYCWICLYMVLTHWGRLTHICGNKLTTIGSDNGLSPGRHRAIIVTNAGILLIGPLATSSSEMLFEIHMTSSKKIHLKMLSGKMRPFCFGRDVLISCCVMSVERCLNIILHDSFDLAPVEVIDKSRGALH